MRAAIIVFPGTNRERDMAIALRQATGRDPALVWHRETALPPLDLVVLPGGFSHGDYLRCGAMAALSPIMDAVRAFADRGGHVLGVCNGFQILTEAGMLPGALLRNAGLRLPPAGRARRHRLHPRLGRRRRVPGADGARRRQLFC